MNSDAVLHALDLTGKLMELHGENAFKARAYANAAYRLSRLRFDFNGKTLSDLESIDGVGKGMAEKILAIIEHGTTPDLQKLLEKTPAGVIEMLSVKGLGPKKVAQLWRELAIENIGELHYACGENRLLTLKGFGEKTQEQVKSAIEFRLGNRDRQLFARVEPGVEALLAAINSDNGIRAAATGAYARRCEVIDVIEVLLTAPLPMDVSALESLIPLPVKYIYCAPDEFIYRFVETSSTREHLSLIGFESLEKRAFSTEEEVYSALRVPFIIPEARECYLEESLPPVERLKGVIEHAHLRGILHNHTTYSDGVHSVQEMAGYCKSLGYEYLGICDHSRSAGYAGGLSIESVVRQQAEIDAINAKDPSFRVLKGIESDILGDGSLDYPEEVLKTFDFVVASVHSNLKMPEDKATARVLKAVENPYTSILGHPTGRLLLARPGYPLDHKKIIDACAANGVAIELNANPNRLDIDWRWIPYCLEKGLKIAINPDAHQREGFHDMRYGVMAARKGLLDRKSCLNAMSLSEILGFFRKRS